MYFLIEWIQSLLLIISAILIIIAAVGLLRVNKNQKNVVYARIHIVVIFDMACILAMIALGHYILAGLYFIIAPFAAHAMSYAYFKTEDDLNNSLLHLRRSFRALKQYAPYFSYAVLP